MSLRDPLWVPLERIKAMVLCSSGGGGGGKGPLILNTGPQTLVAVISTLGD